MNYQLGILDQSPIFPNASAYDALQQTIQLAQKAEKWGYARFWVSEHHQLEQVAGSSPEVLISHLLARTNTIRIGSGGVMLQHYSPYKVAENFHVLSTLAPGRVDLGVGKAPGGFPLSTKALQFGRVNDGRDFEERLTFLQQLIEDSIAEGDPYKGLQALPKPPESPKTFLLGSSANSALQAAKLGIHFVFARFINYDDSILKEAAEVYRSTYRNGRFIVSLAVIAAPTQREAEELASNHKLFRIHLKNSGRTLTVQSYEQALAFEKQAEEPFEIEEIPADIIAGTPSYVKELLDELHQSYQIDEFILHTPLQKEEERVRSFQLLSPLGIEGIKSEERDSEYVS
ncbi:LLM class flavin-dependent oxidoreductase [Bacillus sp. FJAT-50079]|uniref:LLM class flavin-dependent oxidoreductase n=1 Tax=Bacillus sp. FJAT-50079 TaxID=2833577 RepID=UPI001BC928E7|nr:LLM class flavin-dependent oxidoreductase [Bacillus sp. FJAT-50079]MBS4210128.1 LLM class flavin-dependent oxidoreductase [Bacillus sp. FJAT-50079]